MKVDQFNHEHEIEKKNEEVSSQPRKDLFRDCEILCSNKNKGHEYCIECNNFAVICADEECSCHEAHQDCEYFQKIKKIHQKINSKLHPKYDTSRVTQMTDRMIDEVSQIEKNIQNEFRYFGLSQAEEEIAKKIHSIKDGEQVQGSVFKTYKQQRKNQRNNIEDSVNKYQTLIQKSRQIMLNFYSSLEQRIIDEHLKFFEGQPFSKTLNSKILTTESQINRLSKMLTGNLNVRRIIHIYSQYLSHQFSVRKLFQACKNRENLLFIVENFAGKKFGVFSQMKLTQGITFGNNFKESFIFSIDQNIKKSIDQRLNGFGSGFKIDRSKDNISFQMKSQSSEFPKESLRINDNDSFIFLTNAPTKYALNGEKQTSNIFAQPPERKVKKIEVFEVFAVLKQKHQQKQDKKLQQTKKQIKEKNTQTILKREEQQNESLESFGQIEESDQGQEESRDPQANNSRNLFVNKQEKKGVNISFNQTISTDLNETAQFREVETNHKNQDENKKISIFANKDHMQKVNNTKNGNLVQKRIQFECQKTLSPIFSNKQANTLFKQKQATKNNIFQPKKNLFSQSQSQKQSISRQHPNLFDHQNRAQLFNSSKVQRNIFNPPPQMSPNIFASSQSNLFNNSSAVKNESKPQKSLFNIFGQKRQPTIFESNKNPDNDNMKKSQQQPKLFESYYQRNEMLKSEIFNKNIFAQSPRENMSSSALFPPKQVFNTTSSENTSKGNPKEQQIRNLFKKKQ